MIWTDLYLCFLNTPLYSEVHNVLIYTIENGNNSDAIRIYKEYCNG